MIINNAIYQEIENILKKRRAKATEKREYIQNILFNNHDYLSAYNGYNSARFEISKAKYIKDDNGLKKYTAELNSYSEKMNEIINSLGFSQKDFEPKYYCAICNDTGRTEDGKQCKCYTRELSKLTLDILGVQNKPLPSFSKAKYKDHNNLDKIYQKIQSYCDNFGASSKNIVISGSVGTGKSYLAGCIADNLLKRDFNTVFISACELNSIFLKYHTAPVDEKGLYLELLFSCDLLIIDDLGSEPIYKNVTEEYLLMVITERILRENPFIITTNLEQEQLLDRYGDRTLSRLNDKRHGVFISIQGEDLRRLKI